jgi:redox-sensitive bicupin YhaK (pirin superfamily)
VALPDGSEDVDPAFVHHASASLPRIRLNDVDLTVIAGRSFGLTSPVATLWPTLYVHAGMAAGASLHIPVEHTERAVYVVRGSVVIDGVTLPAGSMGVLGTVAATVESPAGATLMLLGGERFPTPRYLFWNFVASSQERIESAKERWRRQEFPAVPNETEFIPLPS